MEDEFYRKERVNNDIVLSAIRPLVDDDYFKAIGDWLIDEENGIWGGLKVVTSTVGEWQNESNDYNHKYWEILKGMYVSQSCGMAGDDYHGTLEINIVDGVYLRASFSL